MQDLLLLHGALGASSQFKNIASVLSNSYRVHLLDFAGHGGKAFPSEKFSIPFYAEEVLCYLDGHEIQNAAIFGYSMGGYVAMYLAKHHPQKVSAVITLASKFHWDEAVAAQEIKMMDAATIELKVPKFAKQLQERHAPADWKLLLQKTTEMLADIGADNTLKPPDYAAITTRSLIMLGDRDKMVTMDETVAVYRQLPNAFLAILPGTPHPFEMVNEPVLLALIRQFLP